MPLTKQINTEPSLYLKAGAIHGCVLCERGSAADLYGGRRPPQRGRQDRRLHVAQRPRARGQTFYTTGRLTSEMVIKTVQMRIPVLISRSGFTAWGVELARKRRADPDRPGPRPALRRARRPRPHRVRRRSARAARTRNAATPARPASTTRRLTPYPSSRTKRREPHGRAALRAGTSGGDTRSRSEVPDSLARGSASGMTGRGVGSVCGHRPPA